MRLEPTDPTRGQSEPGRCWTQTNIREACPEVMSPLCWAMWQRMGWLATPLTWYDAGLFTRAQTEPPEDPDRNACGVFYGRQALNVDLMREIVSLAPGATADDFERDVLGYVREDAAPVRATRRRYPFVLARMPMVAVKQARGLPRVHAEQERWWRDTVLGANTSLPPRAQLADADQHLLHAFRYHLYSRSLFLPAVQGPLSQLAAEVGGAELATALVGGFGETEESEIALDAWELSRNRLTMAEFLRRHGFHGPAEGNAIGRVWREDPTPVEALVRAYAGRPESDAPHHREEAARRKQAEAVATLLAAVPATKRPGVKLMLRVLRAQIRYLGMGKASFLMGIDGVRAAARRIGAGFVAEGAAADVDDAFYLTFDELLGPTPENLAEVVALRRARRLEYQAMELPIIWKGMPEPVVAAEPAVGGDRVLRGVGGSAGVAEGPVRVIHDPADVEDLEAGEILVCHFTDPSWAALFPLAEAVVIDVGTMASHGAVVSRELGIPCVIGTGDGTRRLRTGDRVRVDGSAGTVEVLGAV